MKRILLVLGCLFGCLLACGQLRAGQIPDISDWSIEEIFGQTFVVRVDAGRQEFMKTAVEQGLVGAVLIKRFEGEGLEDGHAAQKRELTRQTVEDLRAWAAKSPRKIPLIIAFDYEGGSVVSPMYLGLKQMPSNMLLAAAADKGLVKRMFVQAAQEVLSLGGNAVYAPDLDVNTNPVNPIIGTRSFGQFPQETARLGTAAFKGLQSRGVAAFVKHFPGHGDTQADSHLGIPRMDLPLEELKSQHISPFTSAVKKGIWGVMSSHVLYSALDPKNPSTFSYPVLTDLLRGELGFEGVTVTDSLDMGGAQKEHGVAQAAEEAYIAGADMPMISRNDPREMLPYLTSRLGITLDELSLRASVQRILKLKEKMGLFDQQDDRPQADKFAQYALEASRKGLTLVRGTLTPPAEGADICTVVFSEPITHSQTLALDDVLRRTGHSVQSVRGDYTPGEELLGQALSCAKNSQFVIIGSTQKYGTPDEAQKKIIDAVLAQRPDAVLLSVLSPYDAVYYPQAKTVLALYGATAESFRTAAEILLGQRKPKGRLPVVLPDAPLQAYKQTDIVDAPETKGP